MIENGKKYIDKCLNEKYINKNYKNDIKPIISVIIPLYNCEKTINASISSIQNQKFTNFEIILINDFSEDSTSKIIEKYKEEDSRIIIVKNKKNMGSLYSRSIGTLISKGEYIFPLDNDDLFFSEDIFGFIIKITKESDLDVVGFRAIKVKNIRVNVKEMKDLYHYNYPDNLIISQPQLSKWYITFNGRQGFHDVTVWCKCIKTKVYKDAVTSLGFEKYSKFVSWAEDTSVNVIIFNIANSFTFINKYGILHLYSRTSASFSQPFNIKLYGLLFLLDVIYDYSKAENKNYAVTFAYRIKRTFKTNKCNDNNNVLYFKYISRKMVNSTYISLKVKNKIKRDFRFFLI